VVGGDRRPQITAAVQLGREIANEWFLALWSGLGAVRDLSVYQPGRWWTLALAWLIGLYAFVFGITLISVGFRVRGHRADSEVQPT
jgi:uncharacterized membrane protein HdeD (DUF308 family)